MMIEHLHARALETAIELERQAAETRLLGGDGSHEELLKQMDCEGISDARERLNMCLRAGVEPTAELLRLSTATLDSLLHAASVFESESSQLAVTQVERAHQLRDGARDQARRFKRERDDARAELDRLRAVAEWGRAFMGLVEQLNRLRAQPHELTSFTFDREDSVNAVRDELTEVLAEPRGSASEQLEAGDVLAAALQLVLVVGESPLRAITLVERRLRARLDLVEKRGITWSQAKTELKHLEKR